MDPVLCVDVGSTWTKALLIDAGSGGAGADVRVLADASVPTTLPPDGDVLDGVAAVRADVAAQAGLDVAALPAEELLVCSSAGGGLRLAVVGYEEQVSALAGHRVALSAGGVVVHVHAGPLDWAGLGALRACAADVVLLTGGTDGGNGEVLLHNARRLASERRGAPVVVAGNAQVAGEAERLLRATGRRVEVVANVMPAIGRLVPDGARHAIRELFLRHVIGGKRLSTSRLDSLTFAQLVRAPTPDAVVAGVGVLADRAGDVLVVDVGGATTDVCSALGEASLVEPPGRGRPVPQQARLRTVEADLGMRRSAPSLVVAAVEEGLLDGPFQAVPGPRGLLEQYAARVSADPAHLPSNGQERDAEQQLATLAVRIAVRRHARPAGPGEAGRPLQHLAWVVGSGGVLRHATQGARRQILEPLTIDHGGGWSVPDDPGLVVDTRYLLFAVGLLAEHHPEVAARLAGQVLDGS